MLIFTDDKQELEVGKVWTTTEVIHEETLPPTLSQVNLQVGEVFPVLGTQPLR